MTTLEKLRGTPMITFLQKKFLHTQLQSSEYFPPHKNLLFQSKSSIEALHLHFCMRLRTAVLFRFLGM